jgi:hypothetical protein
VLCGAGRAGRDTTASAESPVALALPGYGITAVATDGAANVHCTNPAPSATPPGAMSIGEALKTGHRTEYVKAIGAGVDLSQHRRSYFIREVTRWNRKSDPVPRPTAPTAPSAPSAQ